MSNKKKNEIPFWARTGHAKPVTRRDFLAAGIIPFSAALILPQWMGLLLGSEAQAQASGEASIAACATGGSGMPAVMILNLAGGGGLSSNFVPMTMAGTPLASYSKMGMGTSPTLVDAFNGAKFYSQSGILAGINATTAATTRENTAFAGLCVRSQDDTAANPFGIDGLVTKAGLTGSILAQLDRITGGFRHRPAVITPPAPLSISRVEDIANSLGYAGAMNGKMNAKQKQKLAALIKGLSETQARRLLASSSGDQIKAVIECAGIKNIDLNSGTPTGVSLSEAIGNNAAISTAWGNPAANSAMNIYANMTYNVLNGNAGCGTISLGGYDYHDNTRTSGDARDLAAGEIIGRMLQTAALMGKKLFIYVASDGSVVSPDSATGGGPWTSDRGDAGCNYVMAYDPAGRPQSSGTQVGGFTDGQAADSAHIIGNSPELSAVAAFANYMSFAGRSAEFQDVAPGRLTAAQFDEVAKIKG